MTERVDHVCGQPEAAGKHRRHLAVGGEVPRLVDQNGGHQLDPPPRRLSCAHRLHEGPQHLASVTRHHRRHGVVEGQVVATDRERRLGGIRGATEESQECHVVNRAHLVGSTSHFPSELHSQQAGAQPVP